MQKSLKTKIFFDSSVIICASISSKGGSFKLIKLCFEDSFYNQRFICVFSRAVIFEVELNLYKRYPDGLLNFHEIMKNYPWDISGIPSSDSILKYSKTVNEKDVHILASAIENNCQYLITLNTKHLKSPSLEEAALPLTILTPGEFLNRY